ARRARGKTRAAARTYDGEQNVQCRAADASDERLTGFRPISTVHASSLFPNSPFTLCARPRGERPMKTVGVAAALAIALVVAGSGLGFADLAQADELFKATMTGDQEVPPVVTNTTGKVFFLLNKEETAMEFQLHVSD